MLSISTFLGFANVAGNHLYMFWNFYTNLFPNHNHLTIVGKALICSSLQQWQGKQGTQQTII